MIDESRVVGTRAQGLNANVGAITRFLALFFGLAVGDVGQIAALPDGNVFLRILNVFSNLIDEIFQAVRTKGKQDATVVGVGVDVDGRMLAQFVGMLLRPLG